MDEQSDVILTTPENHQVLQSLLPDDEKLISVAMEQGRDFLFSLASVRDKKIGILCADIEFADVVKGCMPEEMRSGIAVCAAENAESAAEFMNSVDCLIVSGDYARCFSEDIASAIEKFPCVLRFEYLIDRGSMIYLQERIGRIRDERQMRPGTFSF